MCVEGSRFRLTTETDGRKKKSSAAESVVLLLWFCQAGVGGVTVQVRRLRKQTILKDVEQTCAESYISVGLAVTFSSGPVT